MNTTDRRAAQVAADVHRTFSKVTARNAEGKVAWRERWEHADREALRDRLRALPTGTPVILEASFGWEWLTEELERAGLDPHLANSRKVAAWREARGMAKSNRTDADLLSELWSMSGSGDRWWEVWLPPAEVRERRDWLRYRMMLVRMQTRLKNQIHAVLHRRGILHEHSDLFGVQGRRFLNRLVFKPHDDRLRDATTATLKGFLQLLDHVRRQIAGVTRTVQRDVRRTPEGLRLKTLPGIGRILAHTLLAEIGDVRRFRSARHLASYSLLAPRAWDSGEETDEAPHGRRVGRLGRRTLKWAWIEAAHGAVRRGGRFRMIFDLATDHGKRDRNRAYIRVAHELCRLAYSMLKNERDYRDAPPCRPGASPEGTPARKRQVRRRKNPDRVCRRANPGRVPQGKSLGISRPGTGLPDRGMVAVPT